MTDVPTERAEEIFCTSLELESEAERMAYVRQACAGNTDLCEAVMKLLASYSGGERLFDKISPTALSVVELANNLTDQPGRAGHPAIPTDDNGEIGQQIGNYKLLQKIGEGGGGNVYLAEQEKPVRRQVAFKIIKAGMDTKSVIARFEAERQTLAMMEHPNIAHVLNAGETETGRPFFVMELVHGTPVTVYCEHEGLDIPQRLELFMQICHAIQHAHQKGIIHRDIKPSNILVAQLEGRAVPKVIDFGIAKAIHGQLWDDGTAFTSMEPFVGTPAYMSPEQADLAEMDIDVRSDIYSLGILLYELLVGKTPFDQKELIRSGLEEMRRTIREIDPPRPSVKLRGMPHAEMEQVAQCRQLHAHRLIALLAGDLDWIVMKALDKDRERRYRSADGLADDIERYLNHEAVVARPPSRLYRLRKLVRRNKVVFAASGIVVAVMLISSSVSTWLLIEQQIARQRAQQAEEEKGTIQREADILRMSIQDQENLARALVLFRRGEIEQADAILDGIPNVSASPGNASMFRKTGDWHAMNGRWEKAKDRFDVLLKINEFEGAVSTMDDIRSAALLAEQGYIEDYERFRESVVNRYAGTDNPTIAQRVVRECLLVPANDELMFVLDGYAKVIERSFHNTDTDQSVKGWQAYAMALWSYRHEEYDGCLYWCEKATPHDSYFPTRDLSVQLIRATVLYQLNQVDAAKTQLDATRFGIDSFFASNPEEANVWVGFWFDRASVRIHLREAESVIEPESGTME